MEITDITRAFEPIRKAFAEDLPRFFRWIQQGLRRKLVILPRRAKSWWYMGKVGDHPAMQIASHWYVTNRSDYPVLLVDVWLRRPKVEGVARVANESGLFSTSFAIPPRSTVNVIADFWVFPPVREDGEEFKATAVFRDQFGKKHKAKRARFRGEKKADPSAKLSPPREKLTAIIDPVERSVATVLKAEIDRYGHCGRRSGGLGSVETTYEGRTLPGIPTQSWLGNSAALHAIADDPEGRDDRIRQRRIASLDLQKPRYGRTSTSFGTLSLPGSRKTQNTRRSATWRSSSFFDWAISRQYWPRPGTTCAATPRTASATF